MQPLPPSPEFTPPTPWYHTQLWIVVAFLCCWPLGLLLVFTHKNISLPIKLVVALGVALLFVLGFVTRLMAS
jgi:hypothetical protein